MITAIPERAWLGMSCFHSHGFRSHPEDASFGIALRLMLEHFDHHLDAGKACVEHRDMLK